MERHYFIHLSQFHKYLKPTTRLQYEVENSLTELYILKV